MPLSFSSEYTVQEKWTYLPKRMSSGKLVWWTTYFVVDKMVARMFGIDFETTLYSKEEWFIQKLSMDDTEPYFITTDFIVYRQKSSY